MSDFKYIVSSSIALKLAAGIDSSNFTTEFYPQEGWPQNIWWVGPKGDKYIAFIRKSEVADLKHELSNNGALWYAAPNVFSALNWLFHTSAFKQAYKLEDVDVTNLVLLTPLDGIVRVTLYGDSIAEGDDVNNLIENIIDFIETHHLEENYNG